ncbi:TraR/DksA C4-type zinc finger protein [Paralimibaculum aggregatum]|uniref:TraR/DksA C4-type zinc finger protein n=1 Tax=Paralimibaculum aggregatum TaxID=3036245 RepID=A0ABQ6LFV8_9RHOB|nr:TraR/DksA family transcriptional regulator [Limibaculum sp. NKW23]GMG81867.1 TraR/DksA C4-type zinc finger protein [Limibaculum sp. NKW23]
MDIAQFKARLLARRDELNRRLGKIEHALDETPPQDWEDRASEREGDEVLEDLGSAGLSELRMIEAALGRIEAGEYGYCVNCGEAIAPGRLEAVPHAARCVRCA